MDVTRTLERYDLQYGGMGSTKPECLAINRRLDYAAGNSITNPVQESVIAVPSVLTYENAVGLYGSENTFVKVNLNIVEAFSAQESFEDPDGYFTAVFLRRAVEGDSPDYEAAVVDDRLDLEVIETYDPSGTPAGIAGLPDAVVSVKLENLKTGNIYIDNYLDMQLYGPDKRAIGSDTIYVGIYDHFYIGFHARRTKRLPYRAALTIGEAYVSSQQLSNEQRRYLVN